MGSFSYGPVIDRLMRETDARRREQELLAACIYARAAGLLALTQQKRGFARPEARYEERAVELLRQTLRRVPEKERLSFWQKNIQSEPALASIRRRPWVAPLVLGFAK